MSEHAHPHGQDAALLDETSPLGARRHVALDRLWTLRKPSDRDALCCHNVTHNQWTLINLLCANEGKSITMGVLAEQLGLTPSGVTRCAEPLVERGLIERCTKSSDRRVCCLAPTEAGLALREEISQGCAAEDAALLEKFTQKEREVIVDAIERLIEAANNERIEP